MELTQLQIELFKSLVGLIISGGLLVAIISLFYIAFEFAEDILKKLKG